MKIALRWLLTLAVLSFGVLHFLKPAPFVRIVPAWLPSPYWMVWISGVAEIAGAIGLQIPYFRRAAAWGLIALFVAVFPANINQAVHHISFNDQPISPVLLWGRLPIQFLLIWVAWLFTRPKA